MKCLSLFANVGIGETYFKDIGIDVVVANEFLADRAAFYQEMHPESKMICGDITDPAIFDNVIQESRAAGVEFIMATPPCQGMSIAHAKRATKEDPRNSLIKRVVQATKELKPKYVLVENVVGMASEKTFIAKDEAVVEVEQAAAARLFDSLRAQGIEKWIPDEKRPEVVLVIDECTEEEFVSATVNKQTNIMPYVHLNLGDDYDITYKVLDAADYNTPHYRKRLITLMSRKDLPQWVHPKPNAEHITVRDVIGDFPSLESEQDSDIKWHSMRHKKHNKHHIKWMQHTPTGATAFNNKIYFPKIIDKETCKMRPISGFKTTYKRMDWNRPAPAVTMMNGSINSQNNVHPGRRDQDGLYSDARVLTIKELCAIVGLPLDWVDHLEHTQQRENFLRKVLGECFPPMMAKAIVSNMPKEEEMSYGDTTENTIRC